MEMEATTQEEVAVVEGKDAKKDPKKATRTAKGKKRSTAIVPRGRIYIQASVNNTIVTVTDPNGNVLTWSSAGNAGFKGPKKSTPFAASVIVGKVADQLEQFGMKDVHVLMKGTGTAKDSALRTINAKGLNVLSIKELTAIPHNGCRPRKPRRV